MITIAPFEETTAAADHNHPKTQAILRTPGNERFVTSDDIAQPLAGDTETKRAQPMSSNGKPRPCLLKCGMPAAPEDIYCLECRSEVGYPQRTE